MVLKKTKTLYVSDPLARVQQNIVTTLDQVVSKEIIDGVRLKNIVLKAGVINFVNHGLNRELLGWQIIRIRSNSIVWDSQDTNKNPATNLALNCSADVTIDLWVF